MAIGANTISSGAYSMAMGRYTGAESFAETVIGHYDTDYSPNGTTSWNQNDRLFVIGNGEDGDSRSDALVMLKNGNTTLNGVLTLKTFSAAPFACLPAQYGSIAANSNGIPCVGSNNEGDGWYTMFDGSACSW